MKVKDYISNRVFDGIRPVTEMRLEALRRKRMSDKDCGCGRSPTGKCIGWHNLTNEEYLVKRDEYAKQKLNEAAPTPILLKE